MNGGGGGRRGTGRHGDGANDGVLTYRSSWTAMIR